MTTSTRSLLVGQIVWTTPSEHVGGVGGMVVGEGVNDDDVPYVSVLCSGQTAPKRQPHIYVNHQDGRRKAAYEDLGPVAHIERWSLDRVDPTYFADHFRDPNGILAYARSALFAAAVAWLPDYRSDRRHDELITAYRVLRNTADELNRGMK